MGQGQAAARAERGVWPGDQPANHLSEEEASISPRWSHPHYPQSQKITHQRAQVSTDSPSR